MPKPKGNTSEKQAKNRAYARALAQLRDRYPGEFKDLLKLELEREAHRAASQGRLRPTR